MRTICYPFLLLLLGVAFAAPSVQAQQAIEHPAVPQVDALFSKYLPGVAGLDEVQGVPVEMAVSSSDLMAAKMVAVGYSYLNAGWDVQAYRYFCGALKRDENCLLAHVGVTLSLASPYYNELLPQRKAAMVRLVELIGLKVKGEYYFPEKERGFAIAVTYLFTSGRKGGSEAFAQLAKQYPKDVQIQLMSAMFKRDGYNALGRANAGELDALEMVKKVYEANPDNVLAQQYMLMMFVEAPVSVKLLREQLLPIARKLAKQGSIATWKHWLGVYEYRCGHLNQAEAAFSESIALLKKWKSKSKVADADSDALWKSYLYLASVQFDLGKNIEARAIAKMFAGLTLDKDRLWASGSQLILWDGYSLGLRLRLPRSGSVDASIAMLPTKKQLSGLKGKTAALNYYEFYTYYLAMRKAYVAKDLKALKVLSVDFERIHKNLAKVKAVASQTGEAHSCLRHFELLDMLYTEMSGVMTADDLGRSLEFARAVEKEKLPSQMLPPLCMHTMESQLVRVLQKRGEYQRAFTIAKRGLKRRPVSLTLWRQYRVSASVLKKVDVVALADREMKLLKPVK